MKYLFVIMVITVSLLGFFTASANGLTCYKCNWTDQQCATEKNDSKIPTVNCESSGTENSTKESEAAPTEAPTEAPALFKHRSNVNVHKYKSPFQGVVDTKYYCFKANVKSNASDTTAVERGCKLTNKTDDCGPSNGVVVYESCVVCDKDNCNGNGQFMVTGSVVQCALMSCLLVARMYLEAK